MLFVLRGLVAIKPLPVELKACCDGTTPGGFAWRASCGVAAHEGLWGPVPRSTFTQTPVCLSIHRSIYLSIYLSVQLNLCLCVFIIPLSI